MKYIGIIGVLCFVAVGAHFLFSADSSVPGEDAGYVSISAAQLVEMLDNEDVVLIDVHTPEQRHIPGTDKLISYRDVDAIAAVAQDDKKLVLYCRSGSMSKIAAADLAERGYAVYELNGGLNEWQAAGYETIPVGSVQ